ncbi:MAG: class I tRNA ligase family protein, partial [Spirochaetia bacterium]
MKAVELAKSFNHKEFEDRIYAMWKEQGYFSPGDPRDVSAKGSPFVIVIPPPNVTGVLHMGHGLNNSLQDVLVRYHRMLGEPTLWVPGTDHAGIATQNVVDRKLRAQGIDKYDLGREKFVEETWKVKEEHHGTNSAGSLRFSGTFPTRKYWCRAVRYVSLYRKSANG